MPFELTNEKVHSLLRHLGFQPQELAKPNFWSWTHAESGCTLVLPANRLQESPRPANLIGLRAQLEHQGILHAEAFDLFVENGVLPTGSVASG